MPEHNIEKTLAIYTGERPYQSEDNPDDTWHHTFLMLTHESQDSIEVLQQLHFFNNLKGNLDVEVREGTYNAERMRGIKASEVLSGSQENILNKWNIGLWHAVDIKNEGIEFEKTRHPSAVRCRKATISTLKSMEVDYSPAHYAATPGTQGGEITLTDTFESRRGWPIEKVEALWAENRAIILNEDLLLATPQQYDRFNRYRGPLPYKFEPMPGVPQVE